MDTADGGGTRGGNGHARRVLIAAGEHSGSFYGSIVAERLKALDPALQLFGVGGHPMAAQGVTILHDSSNWGGIGVVEALKRSPRLYLVFLRLKSWMARHRPDVVILIDYPGFNMRLAHAARALGIPTLYYIPPGKYRSPPEDVLDAARTVTRLAAPLPITYEKYAALHADVSFVGHPILDVLSSDLTRARARAALGLADDQIVVGLLPGSRMTELAYHTPILARTARALADRFPGTRFLMPLVDYKEEGLRSEMEAVVRRSIAASSVQLDVLEGRAADVLAGSDLVLVASGTATLEAAFFGTPMVIIYRTSMLTGLLAPLFHPQLRFIGLPNILANRLLVPELVQDGLSDSALLAQASEFLSSEEKRDRTRRDLLALRPMLGTPGASDRVARMALSMMHGEPAGGEAH